MLKTTEAAKLAGVSNATLHRARKKGKVAYEKDENGHYLFDPSELARAFPKTVDVTGMTRGEGLQVTGHDASRQGGDRAPDSLQEGAPSETVKLLREQIELLVSERDDLRARLDRSEEKRDEAQTKLTALLTNGRSDAEPDRPKKKRWFLWSAVAL